MCNVAVHQEVKDVLTEFVSSNKVFTVYDVTVEARKRTQRNVRHDDTREFVREEFNFNSGMSHYRSCLVPLTNGSDAMVYYPDGQDPLSHPMAAKTQDAATDGDSDNDSDQSEPSDNDDESEPCYQLTCEGRLNIPKSLLVKVSPVGGSYDVSIDGTVKYVKRNKDGRVRIPKSLVGSKGPNFKIEVGTCKGGNCIQVTSYQS